MLAFSNSKINLGLYVTEKRPDGFHNIETIFFPIQLNDIVEILPLKETSLNKIKFTNTGIPVDCSINKNLCIKAYNLLDGDFSLPPAEIILHKAVPMGAGLGGGSADGAFTLSLLNTMFNLGLSKENLSNYASKLGSDCAFFIYNTPMFGSGRGEVLSAVNVRLEGFTLVLVKPGVSVGTSEAYRDVTLQKPEMALSEIISQPVTEWKNLLKNSFETMVFVNHPEIKEIKEELYRRGALYASMSGSGSAVFGIFENSMNLRDAFPDYFYWEGKIE